MEIIHSSWPESIRKYKLNHIDSVVNLTEEQTLNLRSKGANCFVAVSDGTVYAPPGGGLVPSRHSLTAIPIADKMIRTVFFLEEDIKEQIDALLIGTFLHNEKYITLKLDFQDGWTCVVEPNHGVRLRIWMPDETTKRFGMDLSGL